jgi:hypothetical protein
MNKITYYCCDATCDKKVATYGAPCCLEHNPLVGGLDDSVSYETSECPGCGMDLYVGANGYCSHCWVDRFGTDEAPPCSPVEHECSGEDDPACPQYQPVRFEWKDRHNCEDLPPLPVSPVLTEQEAEWLKIQELEEEIAKIKEKVELYSSGMTPRQVDDWRLLWMTKEKRLRELRCWGCRDGVLNQQGHMGPGGCLHDERENPLEDWDEADLRKLDVQMRYGF